MKKLIMTAILACAGIQSIAMQKVELIEFKGEKKPLLGWIMASLTDSEHPFSTTSIVRSAGDKFTLQGDVLDLNDQDMEDVANGNYVYCPFYAMVKTRLSMGTYANIGAIILGTKNKKACDDLHFAHMRNLMQSVTHK